MSVPETIQKIRAARASHKAYFSEAEAFVDGFISEDTRFLHDKNCDFGSWLLISSNRLNGFSSFDKLSHAHQLFHQTREEILALLLVKQKRMDKIFGASKKSKQERKNFAEIKLSSLKSNFRILNELLNTLEKDYLDFKNQPKEKKTMEDIQTQSFRDVAKMMEDLEKDVNDWLK